MQNETETNPPVTSSVDQTAAAAPEKRGDEAGTLVATRPTDNQPGALALPGMPADSVLAGLPLLLDVTIPIRSFRVGDLLTLEKGTVLETDWLHTEDVPVWCGGSQLAWTEFEVMEDKLAVRVTRIS